MPNTNRFVAAVALSSLLVGPASTLALTGCAHNPHPVATGTLIGAATGAVLGTATGVLISDDKLIGSKPESQLELGKGASIGAGALIGVVFGAIVGAMIGHQSDDKLKAPPEPEQSAQGSPGSPGSQGSQGSHPRAF